MPFWYPLVRASRYFGCAPWELAQADAGPWWTLVGLAAEKAEAHAAKMKEGR